MKTVVIGASLNPARYSYKAIQMLRRYNFDTVAIGLKAGSVGDVNILTKQEPFDDIHTVTLYLNPLRQVEYYNYIIKLSPKRIIFNPGTENIDFEKMATDKGIACLRACTLVLLSTGQYEKRPNLR